MSIQAFIEKFNGKYIDFDGAYGAQCFDLFHYYNVQVLGLTDGSILAAPGAKDIYNNFDNLKGHEYFDKIANTPEGVPNEGEIVIWGYNPYGHVAIFIEGDAKSFRSFDQNSPLGSPCHVQNHNYTNVLGWLRFKAVITNDDLLKQRADAFVAVASELGKPVDKDIVLADIKYFKEHFIELEEKLRQSNNALNEANSKLKTIQEEADENKEQVDDLTGKNLSLQDALKKLTEESKDQEAKLAELIIKVKILQEVQPIEKLSSIELITTVIKRFFGR